MEIFLVSRRARFRVFLNEENLEEIEAKNEVKSRRLAEREKDQRKSFTITEHLSHACCVRVYIYTSIGLISFLRASLFLSFLLFLSLSRLSSFIARYRVKRL